jgi:hypothetical protein
VLVFVVVVVVVAAAVVNPIVKNCAYTEEALQYRLAGYNHHF